MLTLDAAYVRAALPRRDTQGHKGDFGKVYVLGGSVGYSARRYSAPAPPSAPAAGWSFWACPPASGRWRR